MYDDKNLRELEQLSHSDNPEIREKARNWLIGIGLQDVDGLRVSPFLVELALRNVKRELTSVDVSRLLDEHYANQRCKKNTDSKSHPLDGEYEIVPDDSPRIKQIEEFNRKLRPELYARLDRERANRKDGQL